MENNIIGYNVYVNGVKYNQEPVRSLRYVVEGLDNGTEYDFTVTSLDEFGNESVESVMKSETPDGFETDISNRTNERGRDIQLGFYPRGMCFSRDEFKFYAVEFISGGSSILHSYDLEFPSTLPDIAEVISSDSQMEITTDIGEPYDIHFNFSDQFLFIIGNSGLAKYKLSIPGDINSAVLEDVNSDISGSGITFDRYGYRMFVGRNPSGNVYNIDQYNASSPWDISNPILSITNPVSFGGESGLTLNRGLVFKDNGSKIYMARRHRRLVSTNTFSFRIYELSLSAPYNIENLEGSSIRIPNNEGDSGTRAPYAITLNKNSSKLLVSNSGTQQIREFILN